MGLFDKLFKKENVEVARYNDGYFQTLTAYRPHFSSWNGRIYESALVRSAIDARARHISKLKVEIIGTAKPALQTKLKLRPNGWQTWSQFLYRTSTILDMHNTAVVVPVFDEFMSVVGYYTVLPKRCEVIQFNGEPWLRYEFRHGEKAALPMKECAVLTRFQYSSDFFGEPNNALDSTMKLEHMNNEAIEEAVKNGARYSFIARVNNFSSTADMKKERMRFTEANLKSDEENSGILLFPNTYTDIKQIDTDAYNVPEKELEEIRTNVYTYFGVNEDVLQSKAYGDAWSAFYESAIEPFAIQFSEAMTHAMFSDTEIQRGTLLMLTANRLQYMSTNEKLNVSSQMADRGIMNRDEIREIWNLPPLPDGQGQAYTIRGEYYLMNDDGTFTREGVTENAN
jgi:HK97 family phage portal protein